MFTTKTVTGILALCAIALLNGIFPGSLYANEPAHVRRLLVNPNSPVATDNAYSVQTGKILYGKLLTDGVPDSDADGDSFLIPNLPNFTGQVVLPAAAQGELIISPTGEFTFTPTVGFVGTATFQYSICDNGVPVNCSNLATVTVTVTAIPAGEDNDGDFIDDIDDLDDDNDGILDINEYCGSSLGVYDNANLLNNERFLDIASITGPFPIAPGTEWGPGYGWRSGVPFVGVDVYSPDTRVSIQTRAIIPGSPAYIAAGFPANGVIAQNTFPGDPIEGVAPSLNYLYSNGNSTNAPYVICEQDITGLKPGTRYSFVCYTSSAINPDDPTNNGPLDPPDDGIMQFFFDGNPTGQSFYVYDDVDPRSFYPVGDPRAVENGTDKWVRREVFFTTPPTVLPGNSYPFSLRDFQLGVNGDDFVLTSIGIREFNTFGCLPSDPSKDDDADGTVNWKDPQWLALVTPGIVLDADGDGIINQFDLDADGDGCADAKEAGHTAPLIPKDGYFVAAGPYGSNGLADAVEKAPASNLLNYTVAVTAGQENYLNKAIFIGCSATTAPTAADKTIPIRKNSAANPSSYAFTAADFGFSGGSGTLKSVIINVLPASGTLTLNGVAVTAGQEILLADIPNLVFTPALDATGDPYANLQFKVRDNTDILSANANTITFIVVDLLAVDDGPYTAVTGVLLPANLLLRNVLSNDVLLPATTLSVVTPPTCGTLTLNANGSFSFDAAGCTAGIKTFTYRLTVVIAGIPLTDDAVATINVVTVPVANNDGPLSVQAGQALDPISILANDVFVGVPTISITTAPSCGTLTANGDGTYRFDATGCSPGAYTFAYQITDANGVSNIAIVTINVTPAPAPQPPVAQNTAIVVPEDSPGFNGNLSGLVSDPNGGPLVFTAITKATTNGTVTINADGSYTYKPNANYNGPDSFTYEVCDNTTRCTTGTVSITVTPANDTPIAVDDLNNVVIPDTPTAINLAVNDTDVDGTGTPNSNLNLASIVITTAPVNGVLAVNANGTVTYTPNAGYIGPDQFNYTIRDNAGAVSNVALVTIDVKNPNQPPVAQTLEYRILNDGTAKPTRPVGSDPEDGANVTYTITTLPPAASGVLVLANGTPVAANTPYTAAQVAGIGFRPVAGFNGPTAYQFKVGDSEGLESGVATVNIIVNIPPIAENKRDTLTNPNRPGAAPLATVDLRQKVKGTDIAPGTVVSYVIATLPIDTITAQVTGKLYYTKSGVKTEVTAAGTVLTAAEAATLAYEPPRGYSGATVKFTYSAIDNDGAPSNTANYNLWIINRPVANDDRQVVVPNSSQAQIRPFRNDTDPDVSATLAFSSLDSTSVRISPTGSPKNGTATVANGIVSYTPNGNFRGTDQIEYIICDRTPSSAGGPLCDTAVINIEVREPFIPEGFTPNGDKEHDYFVIENPNNEQVSVQIFNRWGNIVFESSDFRQDQLEYDPAGRVTNFTTARSEWDGKTNRGLRVGENLPDGTYFYIVKYRNSGFTKARYLTLIR